LRKSRYHSLNRIPVVLESKSEMGCFRQLWPILSPNSQAVLNLVDTVLDREHTVALDVAAVYEASQLSFCRAGPLLEKVLRNLARQLGPS